MEYKDYYQIMGVKKTATLDEIKRAYRKKARQYHPDINKSADAENKFKEIGEAYEVLKDPEKRAAYDQLGSHWQSGQDFRTPPNWDAGFEFSGGGSRSRSRSPFSDFFEELFGRSTQDGFGSRGFGTTGFEKRGFGKKGYDKKPAQNKGQDHHAKVLIDLEDAFNGATRTFILQVPKMDTHGRLINAQHKLNVKIPKGIKQGQKIRLSGQGAQGVSGGARGDLFLEVEFKAHALFQVEGADIYLQLPVTPWEAALGAKIKMPTPTGDIDLNIPKGSTSGQKLRLKGRGIPTQPPGDLYAVLQIHLPVANTEKAQTIYRNMEKELLFNPRAKLGV